MADRLRLGLVGTGWITPLHLGPLERLGRTELVGVISRSVERAALLTSRWGGAPYSSLPRMLDEQQPDAVYVCLPPHRAPAACRVLAERRIPFLTEKPLAADARDAEDVARMVVAHELVTAVGYQWRALDFLSVVRDRLSARPARLVLGRWTGDMPPPPWWRRVAESGGQIVEQATHLYDLGRFLLGEGQVIAATSGRWPRPDQPDSDVEDVAGALLQFEGGVVGSFVNASILATSQVELDLLSDGRRMTIRMHAGSNQPRWWLTFDDGAGEERIETQRDPYELQAEAFLDAVASGDPGKVLSSYADALLTDRLVRRVVEATGSRG